MFPSHIYIYPVFSRGRGYLPFGGLGFWSFHATLGLVYLPLLPDLLSLLLFSILTIPCEVQHTQKLEKTSLTLFFSKNLCSRGTWVAQ